jgi:hypothetical protein
MSISIQGVVSVVVGLIVCAIVFGLLDYLIKSAPFIPDPWKGTIRWVLLALGILVLIGVLLSFISGTPIFRM